MRVLKSLAIFFIAGACFAGTAYAASSGGEAHTNWGDLAWRVVNLFCFLGIIWWAAGKKIRGGLSGRKAAIEQSLIDSEQKNTQAEARLEAVVARIANLDAECETILAQSKSHAEAVKAALIAEAEAQAVQIIEQAHKTAASDARNLVAEVRSALAEELAVSIEHALTAKLDAAAHERLVDAMLKKVVLQ